MVLPTRLNDSIAHSPISSMQGVVEVHAPVTSQFPSESHVSALPLILHLFSPVSQTPVHSPASQPYLQTSVTIHASPSALHFCAVLFTHLLSFGVQLGLTIHFPFRQSSLHTLVRTQPSPPALHVPHCHQRCI